MALFTASLLSLHQNDAFDNAVCSVKHNQRRSVESLVDQKLSELSENEAYLRMTRELKRRPSEKKSGAPRKEAGRVKRRFAGNRARDRALRQALGRANFQWAMETEISALEKRQTGAAKGTG